MIKLKNIIVIFLITLLISSDVAGTIPQVTITGTINNPATLEASCSYIVSTDGNTVYSRSTSAGNIEFSGTLNQVLSFTAKSGNHLCIKNGNYSLSTIMIQPDIIIECESDNAVIKAADVPYLIYLNSNSTVKGCTFNNPYKTKTIYIKGDVKNWNIENNYFVNSNIAVLVENLRAGFPTSGYGNIINNRGYHSKLCTFQGTRNITVTGNHFYDLEGDEFCDFNYNVHYVLFENNTFINTDGYSIHQEVIDMIGGGGFTNSYNILRNNTIIANFQSGIRPSKSAVYNTIEKNYIEFRQGKVANIAGVYLYGGGDAFSTPRGNWIINNMIIGGKSGIEVSGADDNFVAENVISGSDRGINLVKHSFYGIDMAPKDNIIFQNKIYNVNYGVFISSSQDNVISINNITNFRIANIFIE